MYQFLQFVVSERGSLRPLLDRQPGEELSTTLVCCSSRPEYLCEGTPLLLRTRKRKLRYGARRGHVQKTDKEGGTVSFQQQAVLTRYHLSRAQRLSSRGSQPHTHTHTYTRVRSAATTAEAASPEPVVGGGLCLEDGQARPVGASADEDIHRVGELVLGTRWARHYEH